MTKVYERKYIIFTTANFIKISNLKGYFHHCIGILLLLYLVMESVTPRISGTYYDKLFFWHVCQKNIRASLRYPVHFKSIGKANGSNVLYFYRTQRDRLGIGPSGKKKLGI